MWVVLGVLVGILVVGSVMVAWRDRKRQRGTRDHEHRNEGEAWGYQQLAEMQRGGGSGGGA